MRTGTDKKKTQMQRIYNNKQTNLAADALSIVQCRVLFSLLRHVYEWTSRFTVTWLGETIDNINSIVYILRL